MYCEYLLLPVSYTCMLIIIQQSSLLNESHYLLEQLLFMFCFLMITWLMRSYVPAGSYCKPLPVVNFAVMRACSRRSLHLCSSTVNSHAFVPSVKRCIKIREMSADVKVVLVCFFWQCTDKMLYCLWHFNGCVDTLTAGQKMMNNLSRQWSE